MNKKEKYKSFCDNELLLPVFSRPSWLDAVCGPDNWGVALVESEGKVIGSMPFFKQSAGRDIHIVRPPLTQCMGPYIKLSHDLTQSKQLSVERQVMDELISQLPPFGYFQQYFHRSVTNSLPFYWSGFSQSLRYTYVIEGMNYEDYERKVLPKSRRKRINRAKRLGVNVFESKDIDLFYEINKKTFDRKGLSIPYSKELVRRIYENNNSSHCVKIYIAEFKRKPVAASFLVADQLAVYYLMGGVDTENELPSDLSAMDLLIIQGIKDALDSGKAFDFEGSMMETVEKYFRSFGATQCQYFEISKTNSKLLKLKRFVKDFVK